MRDITNHQINEANRRIAVRVADSAGPGGACDFYTLRRGVIGEDPAPPVLFLNFHSGPIGDTKAIGGGLKGWTNEALIAVLIDRYEGYQSGACACPENQGTLVALRAAMMYQIDRERARAARGVAGTATP